MFLEHINVSRNVKNVCDTGFSLIILALCRCGFRDSAMPDYGLQVNHLIHLPHNLRDIVQINPNQNLCSVLSL